MPSGLPVPKPLSVSTSPGLGPAAARAATQDAQIAQLVQQNRALEHTVNQLRAQLRTEEARGNDVVNQIRERWKAESKEWRDGCDILQAKHRLAHLGTRVALEHERGLRLEDKEALMRERTAALFREYKITLFQAKETDLVEQVSFLEDELRFQREEMAEILLQHESELARVTAKLARVEDRQQQSVEQAGGLVQEKEALGTELATLRASSVASAKQIDRLALQLETLQTQNATLETRNRELQSQVEKWQSLESKGEKEVETLRKRRIELEVRVKELEVNLKESRGVSKKIAKLEESLLETQEQVEQGQQDISEAQAEATQAQNQAAMLERQVEKLQVALEAEKTRSLEAIKKEREKSQVVSKPLKKIRPRAPSVIEELSEGSEHEIVALPWKPPPRVKKTESMRSDKPNGKSKGKGMAKAAEDSEEISEHPKDNDGRRVEDKQTESPEVEDGEIVEKEDVEVREGTPPIKTRGRRRNKNSDIEEVPPPRKKPLSARSKQSDEPKDPTKKPRSKAGKDKETDVEDDEQRKKRSRSKPASSNGGPQPSDTDAEEEQPAKKKKRRLNVTGGSSVFGGPAGFTWDQGGDGDLGIPSVLSPVKEGQPVPARSTSSANSILGGWKTRGT